MKQWLLIVFDGRSNPRLMKSLGLSESKSKAGQYVGFYSLDSTPFLRRQIDRLKEAGIHGIAKKVEQRPRPQREPRRYHTKRDKTRFVYSPAAPVIPINTRELKRQAEQTKLRDLDHHVQNVFRRMRGE